MRRIVVTGLGAVTSLGFDRETVWRRLLDGHSGISSVESFDTSAFSVHLGGEIKDFDPAFHGVEDPRLGRSARFAVAAARSAVTDAGLDLEGGEPSRCGVAFGTTSGEPLEVERHNDLRAAGDLASADDGLARRYPCHAIAGQVASALGAAGPVTMLPAACAAGNYALARAFDLLQADRADLMVVGGADAFSRITYTGFACVGGIAPDRCRPFDRERRGMVPGEGAAVLILEPLDRALGRGARIYAEVAGYGLSCDAHHMTAALPDGAGAARAMDQALRHAGMGPEAVDYVSAHGTGTPTNDALETRALEKIFGPRAGAKPVSSVKSMLGHTMGAASAIESMVCCLAIQDGKVPPTINFETPDPDCALDCVPNEARELDVAVTINNASAFGGNNASVIFKRCLP